MATRSIAGKLYIDTSGTGAQGYELLGSQTEVSMSQTTASIDATTKADDLAKEYISGDCEWSISGSVNVDITDAAFVALKDAQEAGELIYCLVEEYTTCYTGQCVVTEISQDAPQDGLLTCSISLQGVGAVRESGATAYSVAGSHYISVPVFGVTGNTDASFDFWIYTTSAPEGEYDDMCRFWDGDGSSLEGGYMSLRLEGSNVLMRLHAVSGVPPLWGVAESSWFNNWHHICASYNSDDKEWKIYDNGVLKITGSYSVTPPDFTGTNHLFGFGASYHGFTGKFLAPRVWSKTIEAGDVAGLMSSFSFPAMTDGLYGQYLRYNDSIISDTSGQGNDATNGSSTSPNSNRVSNGGDYVMGISGPEESE